MSPAPPFSVSHAFASAFEHHRAGRLNEAEALYRQVLAAEPGHAEALHYLGVVAHQVGRYDLAAQLIERAIALNPRNPAAHSNLGTALAAQQRLEEAMAAYRCALRLKSDYPEAHLNLGLALVKRGQRDEAIAEFHEALRLKPGYLEAYYNLGTVQSRCGRFDEAAEALRCALQIKPDYPEAHFNLGLVLARQGRWSEAAAAYRRAVDSNPDYLAAHLNLGNVLSESGQFDAAQATYQRVIEMKPDCAEAHSNLGAVWRNQGRLDDAIAAQRRALEINPDYALAYNNLGNVLCESGQFEEALAAYRRALQLLPDAAGTHYNLGTTLAKRHRLDEAMAAYRRALELQPDHAEAWANLGNAHKDQGQVDEALTAYRRAIQLKPEQAWIHSNVVCALHFQERVDERARQEEWRHWNSRFGEPLNHSARSHANDRDPERRLRIGYVSADLRDHVIGRNLAPLFQRHDSERYEIFCYSGAAREDEFTELFRRHSHHWRNTVRLPDDEVAGMIRRDNVDILVDLTQHLSCNRLTLFAGRPAPVQVSFAGYPAGTGLEAIDNRISDRYLESQISDLRPAEHVFLLDSFWCYDPQSSDVELNRLPALESGRITFGSLNHFAKVNGSVLRLWAKLLAKVKDSRLVLFSPMGGHRQRTLEIMAREGIEAHRLEFLELQPRRDYLELYHCLDVALDPFPYNGHTTSLDALWMGVPVISMVGGQSVGRAGLSQLTNLGLPELAALSKEDYVNIAAELARDLPRPAELRATLRRHMETSMLTDTSRFARGIEAAYRGMWRRWCLVQPA